MQIRSKYIVAKRQPGEVRTLFLFVASAARTPSSGRLKEVCI